MYIHTHTHTHTVTHTHTYSYVRGGERVIAVGCDDSAQLLVYEAVSYCMHLKLDTLLY